MAFLFCMAAPMDGEASYRRGPDILDGMNLRRRPTNLEAEMAVIGSVMLSDKLLARIVDFLRPHHFADPVNGRIFAEQIKRISRGGIADAVTLRTWFEAEPCSMEVGGVAYLAHCMTSMVAPGMVAEYAQTITDSWRRRQIIDVAEELANRSFDYSADSASMVESALEALERLSADDETRKALSLSEAMDQAIAASERAREGSSKALSTGFRSIDEFLGGLEDGTLNVLAGRPGMGKSALCHQMAIAAAKQGVGVLEISLEMTGTELGRRALSATSGVPVGVIKRGHLTAWQGEAIVKARREMHDLPLIIEDGSGLTVLQIAAKVRQAQRKHRLGLIMIDHLHIVLPEDSDVRQGATWAVGRISGAMKRLAKEHNCPVLLAAQLNRSVEGRDDKRPGLSDLRQAGDIEQDADVVSFVYRPEYYLGKGEPERADGESPDKHQRRVDDYLEKKRSLAGKAELIFAKVRDGASGTVGLQFHGATTSFSERDDG